MAHEALAAHITTGWIIHPSACAQCSVLRLSWYRYRVYTLFTAPLSPAELQGRACVYIRLTSEYYPRTSTRVNIDANKQLL
ncbi:hypothetical protein VTO73DRAFT_8264 [Trametes versicolor]